MKILSLCTSAGLWDKAWLEAGHTIIPGCEIMRHKRKMYYDFCQKEGFIRHDIMDLPRAIKGQKFNGVIGGVSLVNPDQD